MSGERMRVFSAQLPERQNSDDKVFVTTNAVIVLDGASAFRPVPVAPSLYAEQLGSNIRDDLVEDSAADLPDVLRSAIHRTSRELDLHPGHSPSSTVAIARLHDESVDALVLGDTPIVFPGKVFCDDRIDHLDLPERREYRRRLATGSGYDEHHRKLLRELQNQQAQRRNRDGGYWIAEADPNAAAHAFTARRPLDQTPWTILATDGVFNTVVHMGWDDWSEIAEHDGQELASLLERCQRWEADNDPDARNFPRAKCHDDKAIAAVRWIA